MLKFLNIKDYELLFMIIQDDSCMSHIFDINVEM